MLARGASRLMLQTRLVQASSCAVDRSRHCQVAFYSQHHGLVGQSQRRYSQDDNEGENHRHSNGGRATLTGGVLASSVLVFMKLEGQDGEDFPVIKLNEKEKKALLVKADKLHDDYEYDTEYDLLIKHGQTSDPDLLWRLARVSILRRNSLNERNNEATNYFKLTVQGLSFAIRARELGESHGHCHLWYGIALNHMQIYRSTKQKVDDVYEMNKAFKRAIELNPKHAYSWHCLGQWHFHVADTSWLTWQAVKLMHSELPKSTYEDALFCLHQAELLEPGFYLGNLWYLVQCYQRLQDKEKVYTLLWKMMDYNSVTEDDRELREKAKHFLKQDYGEVIHDSYEEPLTFSAMKAFNIVDSDDHEKREQLREYEADKRKQFGEMHNAKGDKKRFYFF